MSSNPLLELLSKGGYTFEEGVAVLSRMCRNRRVVEFITRKHRMDYLNQELYKLAKINHVKIPQQRAIVPKSAENAPKHEESAQKSTENVPKSAESVPEEKSDDVVDFLSLHHHENTRLEDMPNDLCRKLWNENRQRNLEIKEQHLRMRKAQTNEERASSRAAVLHLDAEMKLCWQLIDTEIERFNAEKQAEKPVKTKTPDFNVQSYRSYISKALNKPKLSDNKFVELQHRVTAMVECGIPMKPDTIEKLKALGITTE